MARIQDALGLQQPFAKVFPNPVLSRRDPTFSDKEFPIGMRWINKATNQVWTLTSVFSGRAEWDLNSVDPGNVSLRFGQSPIMQTSNDNGGLPTGGNLDVNLMHLQKGVAMEQFLIQSHLILAPRMNIVGLQVSLDMDVGKGVEYNFGADRDNGFPNFTIGTSPAFFFEVGMLIDNLAEANPYLIGFRKVQGNKPTFTDYTDYATIGMSKSLGSLTNVSTRIALNGTAQDAISGTLWGDQSAFKLLRVLVSGSGAVTYTFNGAAPLPPIATVTFDTGDIVCPFIHLLHGINPGVVNLSSMKYGFQA